MNLPTDKECFRIIKKMEMMDHIIDHSVMVSNVAVCLCQNICKTVPCLNLDLNMNLVRKAALLHDITKTRSFTTQERHSETGGKLMTQLGYPEIGDIIRQHVMLDAYRPDLRVSEPEIVNYADKRVLHDQVVSLDQRLDYIKERYGKRPEFSHLVQKMWDKTLALEDKLFKNMPFSPDELAGQIIPVVKKPKA